MYESVTTTEDAPTPMKRVLRYLGRGYDNIEYIYTVATTSTNGRKFTEGLFGVTLYGETKEGKPTSRLVPWHHVIDICTVPERPKRSDKPSNDD